MDQNTEQRIRQRAYDLWVAQGRPEGSHLRMWKEAEAQIAQERDAAQEATKDEIGGPRKSSGESSA